MRELVVWIFIALVSRAGMLWSGIEAYFKPADNNKAIHSMKNIDFIYMINLDERLEKYEKSLQALLTYDIHPFRFSAVNGWKLSFEAINALGVNYQPGSPAGPIASVFRHIDGKEIPSFEVMQEEGVTYYCHSMSRGAIGCILSHLSVLQDAYDSGYQTIWVMEDDIKIVSDPHEISSLISTLDLLAPNWDVLFTDSETKGSDGTPEIGRAHV